MGTFIGLYGNTTIQEEKRNEFTERMLYLLEQGEMINFEQIQVCGKEIALLSRIVRCYLIKKSRFSDRRGLTYP